MCGATIPFETLGDANEVANGIALVAGPGPTWIKGNRLPSNGGSSQSWKRKVFPREEEENVSRSRSPER